MYEIVREGSSITISPNASLVAQHQEAIQRDIDKEICDGVRYVIFDFAEAGFMDNTGIGVLSTTHNALLKAGGGIVIANPSWAIMGRLGIEEGLQDLPLHFSLKAARDSIRSHAPL